MERGINFLRERRKQLTQRQLQEKKIYRWSLVGLGLVLVIFVAAVGVRLYLAQQLSRTQERQEVARRQILSQESNERSYVIFAAKINVLTELFKQRRNKQEAISFFTSAFGSNVLLSDIAYEADDAALTFGLDANNVFTLENVLARIREPEVIGQYESLKPGELRRNNDGRYRLVVDVKLKE